MTGRTHITVGVAMGLVAALISDTTQPQMVACLALAGLIGGALPDIDHPQSIISGWIPGSGLVMWLSGVRHRGVTHSLLFVTITLMLAIWACIHFNLTTLVAVAFACGVGSHLVLDAITPMGIPVFYPIPISVRLLPRFLSPMMGLLDFTVWCGALLAIAGILINV
jgi:inner membrane protein